jgi:hypothetical protein
VSDGVPGPVTVPLPHDVAFGVGPACSSSAAALKRSCFSRARAHTHARYWRWQCWSATLRGVPEHPRCIALLHGGERCRSVAVSGSEFCLHHDRLVAEHGTEALKQGAHLPARRRRIVQSAVVAEKALPTTINGSGNVDPASVRPQLAKAAAESVDEIRRVLLETATGANRNLWTTIDCKHHGRAGRYEITVPDNKVRLDAIQALLHESLGRPGQAEAQPAPVLPASADQVRKLSWDQMTLVFATQFASEISSITNGGGSVLLRQRLSALSGHERRVLREALSDLELVG